MFCMHVGTCGSRQQQIVLVAGKSEGLVGCLGGDHVQPKKVAGNCMWLQQMPRSISKIPNASCGIVGIARRLCGDRD